LAAASYGNGTAIEPGYYLAMSAFVLMFIFQMVYVLRNLKPLWGYLSDRQSLRRRNGWLAPPVVLSLTVGLLAIIGVSIPYCLWMVNPPLSEPTLLLAPIWPLCWGFLLILSAVGMWHNETWACWMHLLQGAFPVLCLILYFLTNLTDFDAWRLSLCLLPVGWWLYAFFASYHFSAHWLQRRRCGGCGRKRWLRAGRCGYCGERYWIDKDSRTASICLACGTQQQAPRPVCKPCRAAGVNLAS
jgi:hypothetical protein